MTSQIKNSHYARLRRQFRDKKKRITYQNSYKTNSLSENEIWIYGFHAVSYALKNPKRQIIELLITQNTYNKLEKIINCNKFNIRIVSITEIKKIIGSDAVHQGILLRTLPLPTTSFDQHTKANLVVLLDQITDPHNVGAIMRSAVALEAKAIITTERHHPKESAVLAKAASGALELIDYITVKNLSQTIQELQEIGFQVIGLDSEAENTLSNTFKGNKIALVLGAEGKGLREKTKQKVSTLARLDINGSIKSLNVSNAAALSLYCAKTYLN